MFFNGHAYAYICNRGNNPKGIVGSGFPDICLYILTEEKTHYCGKSLYEFCEDKYPDYTSFAEGAASHIIVDNLTENKYNGAKGYLLQGAWEHLAKIFGKRVHYVPELWIDVWITKKCPELPETILASIEEINVDELSNILGEFFNEPKLTKVFPKYLDKIKAYEKAMPILKHAGIVWNKFKEKEHIQFCQDISNEVEKYLKELAEAKNHGKRAIKRITGHSVLPRRQSRPSLQQEKANFGL